MVTCTRVLAQKKRKDFIVLKWRKIKKKGYIGISEDPMQILVWMHCLKIVCKSLSLMWGGKKCDVIFRYITHVAQKEIVFVYVCKWLPVPDFKFLSLRIALIFSEMRDQPPVRICHTMSRNSQSCFTNASLSIFLNPINVHFCRYLNVFFHPVTMPCTKLHPCHFISSFSVTYRSHLHNDLLPFWCWL